MSTIVLVNVGNGKRAPVGLIYLASILNHHGYDARIFTINSKKDENHLFRTILGIRNILFIGFSAYVGRSVTKTLRIAERIKSICSNIPIIVGGKFPSSGPNLFLAEPAFDAVCTGDGEATVLEFAQAVSDGMDKEKQIYGNPPEQDLDSLPFDMDLIDWSSYAMDIEGKRTLIDGLETQRGCKYRCRFCYRTGENNQTPIVPSHSLEWVMDKIRYLKDVHGIEAISFADDEFWTHEERAFALIELINMEGIQLKRIRMRFSTAQRKDVIDRIAKLGISSLTMGLEAGYNRMYKLMKKGLTEEMAKRVISDFSHHEIDLPSFMIMGSPTETKQEYLQNIRFGLELSELNCNFWIRPWFYSPFPTTHFYDLAVENGFKPFSSIRYWDQMEYHNVHKLGHQWLPWFTKRDEKNFELGAEYLHLWRTFQMASRKRKYLRWIYKWFVLRLWYWDFRFPFELFIAHISGISKKKRTEEP
jgi:radical SAM superfamily enzyme YgiQ (UPF0313 family)